MLFRSKAIIYTVVLVFAVLTSFTVINGSPGAPKLDDLAQSNYSLLMEEEPIGIGCSMGCQTTWNWDDVCPFCSTMSCPTIRLAKMPLGDWSRCSTEREN